MVYRLPWLCLLLMMIFIGCSDNERPRQNQSDTITLNIPSPIYIDPNYHGSCDPEIVWNSEQLKWYIYYTSRRATQQNTWLGTPIGVISSENLVDWNFEGYCKFDGKGGNKDASSSYWAPAIIEHEGQLHMFVTWKPDTLPEKGPWGGPGKIVHYTTSSEDPIDGWQKVEDMHGDELTTIDATVYERDSLFHVWFKGRKKGEKQHNLYHLTSRNMQKWENRGFSESDVFNKSITGTGFEEAPYIFRWKEQFWLITDPHKGLFVYNSKDGEQWNYQGVIMDDKGKRKMDGSRARHPSVAVVNGRAFIFYHVEPWRNYSGKPIYEQPVKNRRSVLQMAELKLEDGKLVAKRDKEKLSIEDKLIPTN